ncbi:unnamed protein product [Bemisia tabaci]|uniref:Ionotropic receptor n=1 Tax=Bemisia tabaci TaxID=7038 RepID=A0A9P0AKY0_BEMTA|nr:unnamed protein product [Bemisia tabaci]
MTKITPLLSTFAVLNSWLVSCRGGLEIPALFVQDGMIELSVTVCMNTVTISRRAVFHIINFTPNFPVTTLIHSLHEKYILTHTINDPCQFLGQIGRQPDSKNIIFFLKNFNDLSTLILNPAKNECDGRISGEHNFTYLQQSGLRVNVSHSRFKGTFTPEKDATGASTPCDLKPHKDFAALDRRSVLTNRMLNLTHGFYNHTIWNYRNHLIFVVLSSQKTMASEKNAQAASNTSSRVYLDDCIFNCLVSYFKFFWRIFKGQRAVICLENTCYRYDPYAERLSIFNGLSDEEYFDFSLTDLHGKTLRCGVELHEANFPAVVHLSSWASPLLHSISLLQEALNCSVDLFDPPIDIPLNSEAGLKYDLDLISINGEAGLIDLGVSDVDHTVSVESCALCIVAPRRGFKPPYLVVFLSFSGPLWLIFLASVLLSIAVQRHFQQFQVRVLGDLYTDRSRSAFENTSAIFMIYGYFICGSPPRLLLGKWFTGRILFLIFSFSALIIVTVYQSEMVTLLSNRVRYEDIQNIGELQESDLFIQTTSSSEEHIEFLRKHPDYAGLETKLFTSYRSINDVLSEYLQPNIGGRLIINGTFYTIDENLLSTLTEGVFSETLPALNKALISVMHTDAFFVNIPQSMLQQKNFLIRWRSLGEPVEWHRLDDCVFMYPFAYRVLRNSPFFEALNHKVTGLLESGIIDKAIGSERIGDKLGIFLQKDELDEEPRPFTMTDLQSAFLFLCVGLSISGLVFVFEMYQNLTQ